MDYLMDYFSYATPHVMGNFNGLFHGLFNGFFELCDGPRGYVNVRESCHLLAPAPQFVAELRQFEQD